MHDALCVAMAGGSNLNVQCQKFPLWALDFDRPAPRKPRLEGRGQGELYKNVLIPYREAPPGRAGRLHILKIYYHPKVFFFRIPLYNLRRKSVFSTKTWLLCK